eukprot:scaffold4.g5011.t1
MGEGQNVAEQTPAEAEAPLVGPGGETLSAEEEHAGSSGSKRKTPDTLGRFKVVGQMVLAMQRFKASLNPTYTYGKRPESSLSGGGSRPGSTLPTEDAEAAVASVDSTPRGFRRSTSNNSRAGSIVDVPIAGERYTYATHGHKGNYLFKPLPPAPGEEVPA